MKKTLFLLLLAIGGASSVKAQFFKEVINTVKQTAQSRANSKADQTTNKTIDKVDSATFSRQKGSSTRNTTRTDTAAMTANLSKMLGLAVGGGGVSAADSAAAFESFKTGTGGSGIFYQYTTSISSKKNPAINDTSQICFTNNGSGRSEMAIPMPGVKMGKIISLGHASQPQYSIQLYADTKTYGLTVIDTSLINAVRETYQVTKVGTETINGWNCTHVKLKSTVGSGLFKSSSEQDIWTSTDVPGYDFYKKMVAVSGLKLGMTQALENAGAGGFLVKMQSAGKDYSMTMILTDAEKKSFPPALFQIPDGYTKTDDNMMSHMMSGAMQSGAKQSAGK